MASAPCTACALILGALSLPLGGCGACEPDRTVQQWQDSPSAGQSIAASFTSAPPAARPQPPALPCRSIAIEGDVRIDGEAQEALALGAEIPRDRWLLLAPNARVVAKDPRSGRETTFRGPGRVRACVGALEESWLASGTFESTAGAGESPGAEEWVVTPFGVVRFGAAQLNVDVSSKRQRLRVGAGTAFLWPATDLSTPSREGGAQTNPMDEALEKGWVRLSGGSAGLTQNATRTPLEAARWAVDACAGLGSSARALASALFAGDASPTMAMEQVTTRRLARAACTVGALRLDLIAPSEAKESVLASLRAANEDWRTLPADHR
ncbi:MAG: hypothetical protein M3O46_23910 [Myxococcota bacterium]|nr:hypothetical protein [Myxococcota bacterium]